MEYLEFKQGSCLHEATCLDRMVRKKRVDPRGWSDMNLQSGPRKSHSYSKAATTYMMRPRPPLKLVMLIATDLATSTIRGMRT